MVSNGQIINALSLHGPTQLFCVSTLNEETEQNWVQVWRRKTLKAEFGPFNVMTLDFKLISRDYVCMNDPSEGGQKLSLLAFN